jgi:hypothetical protein
MGMGLGVSAQKGLGQINPCVGDMHHWHHFRVSENKRLIDVHFLLAFLKPFTLNIFMQVSNPQIVINCDDPRQCVYVYGCRDSLVQVSCFF